MDEIDGKTWVLEPENPTRSATTRRIAIGMKRFEGAEWIWELKLGVLLCRKILYIYKLSIWNCQNLMTCMITLEKGVFVKYQLR